IIPPLLRRPQPPGLARSLSHGAISSGERNSAPLRAHRLRGTASGAHFGRRCLSRTAAAAAGPTSLTPSRRVPAAQLQEAPRPPALAPPAAWRSEAGRYRFPASSVACWRGPHRRNLALTRLLAAAAGR